MKLQNKIFTIPSFLFIATTNFILVSCGSYQSVYNEDGIYDNPRKFEKRQAVIIERNNPDNYEDNYFSKKLDSLEIFF